MISRLNEIFRERRRALERFVTRYLRNPEDAEDVAQEAFLRVYAAEVGGQTPASEALLYTVARNLALSELRRRTSRATDGTGDLDDLDLPDASPNPEMQLQQRQMIRSIEEAMKEMPPRCLEAFRLRKIDGLSQADIAERMAISPKTVERHITLALQLCNEAMADKRQRPRRQAGEVP